MTKHEVIAPHNKRKIYERDGGLCAYCGRRRNIKYMTIDHIIPLSRGGTDDFSNLRCACKMCNKLKDDMLPHEFTTFVRCILEHSIAIEKSLEKMS